MSRSDTWAVFSAYQPPASLIDAVKSVQSQVAGVVIVDDGSGAAASDILDPLRASGAQVLVLARNQGIATALNRGIRIALDAGAHYVLTFDQDSYVPEGFVSALRETADRAVSDGLRVGAIVPEYFAGVRQGRGSKSAMYSSAAAVIQSGMLVPAGVLRAVGGLREDFFIDLIDTEFELRLRRAGRAVIAAHGVRLAHSLGKKYRRELFGWPVRLPGVTTEITLSTPFRYFYRVRNRCVLTREYLRFAPAAVLRAAVLDAVHFVDVLRVSRPRQSMWRVQRAGLRAAWSHRMGIMPPALVSVASGIRWSVPPVDQATGGTSVRRRHGRRSDE